MISNVIITFIHGTWAREASWTKVTSPLAQELRGAFGDIHFEQFLWSGSNSHRARWRAALDLRRHVLICSRKYEAEDHFLIGHSHGSNVALYALRDETVAACVRGVVCLSTPFIHCRRRKLGDLGIPIFLLAFIFIESLLLAGLTFLLSRVSQNVIMLFAFLLTLIVFIASFVLLNLLLVRYFSTPDLSEALRRIEDSFSFPDLAPNSILVVSASGDEAVGALATSHFLSFLLTGFSRAICSLCELQDRYFSRLPFVSRLCFFTTAAAGGLLLPIVLLITVATIPFGFDTALLAIFFELSAENVPRGRVTITQLSGDRTEHLQHGLAYDSPEAFSEMIAWIKTNQCA